MKWIVITLPDFIENESTYINQLFKAGIDLLHLRKPESNIEECKRLIQKIDKKWHKKDRSTRSLRTLSGISSSWYSS